MTYISRKVEKMITSYLPRPEIIAVVGPRQCGKTTTLRHLLETLPNAVFLTFEDQDVLSLFEHDIKAFAETYLRGNAVVFIDEFQYAKEGGKQLKYLYDVHRSKLIISGSSAIDLTVKAIKFLVGRVLVVEMLPFDFLEMLRSRDPILATLLEQHQVHLCVSSPNTKPLAKEQEAMLLKYYEEYMSFGGYPAVVLADRVEEKKELLKNIYNTYFLRDVKSILGLVDDYKLSKLIRALALQVGNLVEFHELSQVSEWSIPTLKKYLNFLSKTYVCNFLRPFYKNKRKEIVKSQKVYFFDLGLRNVILNDFRSLESRLDTGALCENAFWVQMKKLGFSTQYWRDKNKNEVDFIVDCGEGRVVAIEAKTQLRNYAPPPLLFSRMHPDVQSYLAYLQSGTSEQKKDTIFLPLL